MSPLKPLTRLLVTPHEIVVAKPAGLASELPRDATADSLVTRLRAEGFDDLRLVHRLDAPACGLMVVARTENAAAHYSAEIAARRWHKFYVAEVARDADRAAKLIGEHKAYLSTEGRKAIVVRSGGKPSFLTIVHVSAAPRRTGHSHVLVQLHTGRFHQIRVMLATLGAPLAGDELYGGPATGPLYLEHALLAARPFGATQLQVWRAPAHDARPTWASTLERAIATQATSLANAE
ncbi:MAG TPA: RNA pseudouridine synthase [Vicinamibacterales bacterium]|nr:RNA pseudouridine synthase [Vicinamibacterales bacterium]